MKSAIKFLVVLELALAALSQPTHFAAADVNHFSSHAVDASFGSLESGCIHTNVDVMAAEQIRQTSPGSRQPADWIFIHVFQADFCNNVVIHTASASVPISDSELEFTGKLNSATLHKTVSLLDFDADIPFEVTVDLTWTVNDSMVHENFNSHFNSEDCHFVLNFVTAYRFAEVSGTVMLGDTNLTPEGSQLAGSIFKIKSGQVVHGCG